MAAATCAETKDAAILHITSEPTERVEHLQWTFHFILRCRHRKPLPTLRPCVPRYAVMIVNGIHAGTIGMWLQCGKEKATDPQAKQRGVVLSQFV